MGRPLASYTGTFRNYYNEPGTREFQTMKVNNIIHAGGYTLYDGTADINVIIVCEEIWNEKNTQVF